MAISGGGSSFRDFFKGFYIQTAETKKDALLNFSPAYSKMTLHWHNPGDTLKYFLNYYFSLSNALYPELLARFNQIKSTKAGALSSLKIPGDIVPSTASNGITYIQAGPQFATDARVLIHWPGKHQLRARLPCMDRHKCCR